MSSSSSSPTHWIYDVFINFRGKDTRKTFVADLNAALSNEGISTFIDDELPRGMGIKPELVRAIEGSRISIIVFSENYASSRWCLDELVKIMECCRTYGQVAMPIFYDVDPSHVRKQTGPFGKHLVAFKIEGMPDKLNIWRNALAEASNLAGWDSRNFRKEGELVENVVEDINKKLDRDLLSITKFQVGLESRVRQVVEFIEDQPRGKGCVVGILGMGGLGKTTLAKVIYNKNCRRFKHRCFIENIREVDIKNSKECIDLQEKLLSGLRISTREKIHSSAMGTAMIEKRLLEKEALIVLDDVTNFEQLKALCGNRKWIVEGSVLIITTRDERLLNELKADHKVHICRAKEMDKNESLELFNFHAFKEEIPTEEFIKLSTDVIAYCAGLPLALEVLGSYLFDRTEEEWEDVLSKLKNIPNDKVQEKLKISYDGLDSEQKKIFLDVCFFFIGKNRADVTEILKGCDLHPEIGITTLVERSLIKLEKNNKLSMHDLIRDMGREIVRQSYEEEPEKRSRLWVHKEVFDVLSNQTGTKAIEGLTLKSQTSSPLQFNTKAFEKMRKLRLLQLDHVQLDGDYDYLNKDIRWICWQRFPLENIPGNLYQGNLISIELKYSNIRQVWKKPQLLERLKILNLSHSRNLISTPDFSKLPNLAKLILKDCPSLSEVHQSIGDLTNLLVINLTDCTSLSNLPMAIYQLKSVQTLILSGCSKIDKLEDDIEKMESLTTLIAKDTAVKEMPRSIVRLKNIGYISLCGHQGLARDIFPSLIWSWMSPTANVGSSTRPFGSMSTSQISMDIRHKNSDDLLPMLHGVSKHRCILVQCDSEFQLTQELRRLMDALCDVKFTELERTSYPSQISENAMKSYLIGMGSCDQVINMLSKIISEGLANNEACDAFLPGDKIHYWLVHTGEGPSVRFTVPEDCCMKGMALCVIYLSTPENTATECLTSVLMVNYTKCTIQIHKQDTVISFNDEDWQSIISDLGSGDKVEIFVTFGYGLVVKKTVVYLIYGESIDMKMEPSPEPKKKNFVRITKKIEMGPMAPKTLQEKEDLIKNYDRGSTHIKVLEAENTEELNLSDDDEEITSQAMDKSNEEKGEGRIEDELGKLAQTRADMEISPNVHLQPILIPPDSEVTLGRTHIQQPLISSSLQKDYSASPSNFPPESLLNRKGKESEAYPEQDQSPVSLQEQAASRDKTGSSLGRIESEIISLGKLNKKIRKDQKKEIQNSAAVRHAVNQMSQRQDQFYYWFNTEVLPNLAPQARPFPYQDFQIQPLQTPSDLNLSENSSSSD